MNQMMAPENNFLFGMLIFAVGIWTLFWKGVALWRAAKYEQRNWFITFLAVILLINTMGIIELVYLFKFCKKPLTIREIKTWLGLSKTPELKKRG